MEDADVFATGLRLPLGGQVSASRCTVLIGVSLEGLEEGYNLRKKTPLVMELA
ncbi:hypothetical protein [Rhizobium sp. RM]|uniref:hypothetical protein n=1 Tax=Rhizobium sp. RM TaxID=2748079 RepID=UPI0015B4DEA1|nr:hypothetical protein [Rhizobium sp. RM]